jgi:hypothetical protein
MMLDAMRVPAAVAAGMAVVTAAAPAAMAASVATAVSALRERRACQHAGKGHRGNSHDRSHHRTLSRKALPLRHRKLAGIGTGRIAESSRSARP